MSECQALPREAGAPSHEGRSKRRFSLLKRRPSVSKESVGVAPGVEMPKRKDSFVRRRSLRLMTLPFRQATAQDGLRRDPPAPVPLPTEALPTEAPSVFERECLNNLSPNDPEFVRRTSMRWKRKTAAVLRHREMLVGGGGGGPPQGLAEPPLGGAPWGGAPLEPLAYTRFEWRTHPSQQPAFYRRVSSPQGPCYLVEATMPPTHCPQRFQGSDRLDLRRPRRRFSASEASSKTREGRRRKTSHQPSRRKSSGRCVDERVADAFHRFLRVGGRRKVSSPSSSSSSSSRKPQEGSDRTCGVGGSDHLTAPTTFYRLSQRLRRSFRGHSSDVDDASSDSGLSSLSSSSHLSALSSRVSSYSSFRSSASSCSFTSSFSTSSTISSSSFTASPSCHSDMSSSASCHSDMSAMSSSSSSALSSSSSSPRLGFHEIFVGEPEIAEQFAIMFPSEPRPEWHRHLRQVLHKAGQKIFKKPEHHDTHIPEDLRYQLKQIYVY